MRKKKLGNIQPGDTQAVVGEIKKSVLKGSVSKRAIIIALFLVLVLTAGSYFILSRNGSNSDQQPKPVGGLTEDMESANNALMAIDEEVQNGREVEDAVTELEGRTRNADSVGQAELFASTAINYLVGIKKYDRALELATEFDTMFGTAMTASSVAWVHKNMNNKEKAVEYYQVAMDRSEITDASQDSPYNDFKARKEAIEKGTE